MAVHEVSRLLLVGAEDDVVRVASTIETSRVSLALANEKSGVDALPPSVDLVVYVMSEDCFWSTQVYSLFTYVNRSIATADACAVFLDGAELPPGVFPSMPTLPTEQVANLSARCIAALERRSLRA